MENGPTTRKRVTLATIALLLCIGLIIPGCYKKAYTELKTAYGNMEREKDDIAEDLAESEKQGVQLQARLDASEANENSAVQAKTKAEALLTGSEEAVKTCAGHLESEKEELRKCNKALRRAQRGPHKSSLERMAEEELRKTGRFAITSGKNKECTCQ